MEFYNRCGKKQDEQKNVETFVKEYEKYYFLCDERDSPFAKHENISRVSSNSYKVEVKIDDILKNGIRSNEDVDTVLAWKIGGIDHKKSAEGQTTEFRDGWKEGYEVKTVFFKCNRGAYNRFCDRIVVIAETFNGCKEIQYENILIEILRALDETGSKGFGPVYIMTLLYFISKGQSPIFDRFAYKSVNALLLGKRPCEIEYHYNSSKKPGDILKVLDGYKDSLKQVVGKSDIDRSLDRALWVYGHSNSIKS